MIKFTVAYHHKISMQKCPYGESCNNVISICIILYTAADLRLRLFCVIQQHENDIFVFSILIKSNARAKTKMLGDTMRLRKQMASICRGHFPIPTFRGNRCILKYHCCTLCKFSKRSDNWNGCPWRTRFRPLSVNVALYQTVLLGDPVLSPSLFQVNNIRYKNADGMPAIMLLSAGASGLCWLIYGMMLEDPNVYVSNRRSWWRHDMERLSAIVALCGGNPPINGECTNVFPAYKFPIVIL